MGNIGGSSWKSSSSSNWEAEAIIRKLLPCLVVDDEPRKKTSSSSRGGGGLSSRAEAEMIAAAKHFSSVHKMETVVCNLTPQSGATVLCMEFLLQAALCSLRSDHMLC
ncbi:hypothetical protein LINPERHAP1_LOCUS31627 [Linum perenne]